jgi:type I restriction enzyme M protein
MSRRARATAATTAQRLGSIVKSARDIMRKDKGLSGDLDRLPMLTWIMFLKFLDDMEVIRETEAQIQGRSWQATIDPPYRWRDWAAQDDGISGDALIAFVNNERAMRPNGTDGLGLFAHLRALQGADGGDRRDVIATVFRGTVNRMINGYLLRDVINKVDEIHFTSSDEIHVLGTLYESMLREMRDAAGDSGEFYTPRPVVGFMVEVTDPRIGETVLDPACGTGGFLVESYLQMLGKAETVEDRSTMAQSIVGGEAKPLPYLLAQMNLLLHGIESPQIFPGNSLGTRLTEIGERERVDVILTNPPFGGEEERGIEANFPADRRTSETALLFLQLIMRKLRRRRREGFPTARAAVVVPDGTLFGDGVAARIKEDLLTDFNLHTIVRLPKGVFAPYSDITTNLLFFEVGGPTTEVWYHEVPPPSGKRQFTKREPIRARDFDEVRRSWKGHRQTSTGWVVSATELREAQYNLDQKNPHRGIDEEPANPADALERVIQTVNGVEDRAARLRGILDPGSAPSWPLVPLREVLSRSRETVRIDAETEYRQITVRLWGKGVVQRDTMLGLQIASATRYVARTGQVILSRIDARNGAMGIVPPDLDGAVVTNDFPLFETDRALILPEYFGWLCRSPEFVEQCRRASEGTTNRIRLDESRFMQIRVRLPSLDVQATVVRNLSEAESVVAAIGTALDDARAFMELLTVNLVPV